MLLDYLRGRRGLIQLLCTDLSLLPVQLIFYLISTHFFLNLYLRTTRSDKAMMNQFLAVFGWYIASHVHDIYPTQTVIQNCCGLFQRSTICTTVISPDKSYCLWWYFIYLFFFFLYSFSAINFGFSMEEILSFSWLVHIAQMVTEMRWTDENDH